MQNDRLKFKNEFKPRAYSFALDIISFVDQLPKEQTSSIVGHQLLRSATSIGANVIEAEAANSKEDYTNFFSHALKSANKTKFWLALVMDSGKADKSKASVIARSMATKQSLRQDCFALLAMTVGVVFMIRLGQVF